MGGTYSQKIERVCQKRLQFNLCCASTKVGLQNDAVLHGDAAPAPPVLPASASYAASLRRLRVSVALPRASRRRFTLASMHFRTNTFRSCPRLYRHIHRLTS